eukprot:5034084-Prymnesium_polylepis.1
MPSAVRACCCCCACPRARHPPRASQDGEMVEALRPVLRGDGKRLRALEEAAGLKDGSKEQRAALKVREAN